MDMRNDPVLTIWQVKNGFVEAEIFPETDEVATPIAEAEMILCSLTSTRRLRLVSSGEIGR